MAYLFYIFFGLHSANSAASFVWTHLRQNFKGAVFKSCNKNIQTGVDTDAFSGTRRPWTGTLKRRSQNGSGFFPMGSSGTCGTDIFGMRECTPGSVNLVKSTGRSLKVSVPGVAFCWKVEGTVLWRRSSRLRARQRRGISQVETKMPICSVRSGWLFQRRPCCRTMRAYSWIRSRRCPLNFRHLVQVPIFENSGFQFPMHKAPLKRFRTRVSCMHSLSPQS